MRNNESERVTLGLKAVSSSVRLAVMDALKRPLEFPPQVDGDREQDGICADFIRERTGLAAATVSRHLTILADAGLLVATRRKGWTFYRRDEQAIAEFVRALAVAL